MVRVKVPAFSANPDSPDHDENQVDAWRTEAALVHIFECERTRTERVWGCEDPS